MFSSATLFLLLLKRAFYSLNYVHIHACAPLPSSMARASTCLFPKILKAASQLHVAVVQREKLCQGIYATFLNCDFGFARCVCVCAFKRHRAIPVLCRVSPFVVNVFATRKVTDFPLEHGTLPHCPQGKSPSACCLLWDLMC